MYTSHSTAFGMADYYDRAERRNRELEGRRLDALSIYASAFKTKLEDEMRDCESTEARDTLHDAINTLADMVSDFEGAARTLKGGAA